MMLNNSTKKFLGIIVGQGALLLLVVLFLISNATHALANNRSGLTVQQNEPTRVVYLPFIAQSQTDTSTPIVTDTPTISPTLTPTPTITLTPVAEDCPDAGLWGDPQNEKVFFTVEHQPSCRIAPIMRITTNLSCQYGTLKETHSVPTALSISDNHFSYGSSPKITGDFTSSTEVSGTWSRNTYRSDLGSCSGSGTWRAQLLSLAPNAHLLGTLNYPVSIAGIDLDGDQDTDILGITDLEIDWWQNLGSGQLTKERVDTASFLDSVGPIDLDQDEDIDLVGADFYGIAWWQNDGSTTFTKQYVDRSTSFVESVSAADIDADGDIDIVSGHFIGIYWWENDGTQGYTKHTISSSASGYYVLATDLDGDGDGDILMANSWYENDGTQHFTSHTIENSSNSRAMAVDMDGDQDIDIVGIAPSIDELAWWENDGAQTFTKHGVAGNLAGVNAAHVVDLDGDGDLDLIASSKSGHTVAKLINDGSNNFALILVEDQFYGATSIHVADIDDDGDLDIIGAADKLGVVMWWEQ